MKKEKSDVSTYKKLNKYLGLTILAISVLILLSSVSTSSFDYIWVFLLFGILGFFSFISSRKNWSKEVNGIITGIDIFIIALFIFGIVGYSFGLFTTSDITQTPMDLQKYSETKEKIAEVSSQFSDKLTEYFLSNKAGDTVSARNKISEARNLLINLKNDYEFACDFQGNNREIFGSETETTVQQCKGYLDLMKFCYPQYLDSLYSLTYLSEQIKQAKTQQDISNVKNSCNSWINDYNVVRGSCNTISQQYRLDVKFDDFSITC